MGKMIGSWSPQVPAGSPSGIPWNSYLRGVDVIKVRQTTHAAVRGVHSAVEHHHLAPRSTTACAEMFENGGFRPILGVAIWIGHDDSLVEVWLRLNLTRCTKSLSWRQQNWWSGRAWERGISSMGWPYFDMQNIFHRKQWGFYHLKTQSFPASLQLTLGHWNFLWVKNGQRKTSIYSKEVQAATLGCAFLDASHVVIKEITNPNCRTYGRAGTPSPKSKILNLDILINGNSRILKWRYFSTIVLAIFCFFPLPKKKLPSSIKI